MHVGFRSANNGSENHLRFHLCLRWLSRRGWLQKRSVAAEVLSTGKLCHAHLSFATHPEQRSLRQELSRSPLVRARTACVRRYEVVFILSSRHNRTMHVCVFQMQHTAFGTRFSLSACHVSSLLGNTDRRCTSVWSEVIHLSSAQWVALRAGHAGNICSILACSGFNVVHRVGFQLPIVSLLFVKTRANQSHVPLECEVSQLHLV